jgi:flagellar protein FliO/FliZ
MRYLLLPVGLISNVVLAQTESTAAMPLEPLALPYLLKLTAGLVLVVLIIFALAWLVKKFNLNQQSQNGLIRIVAGMPIGTRDRILLLEVGEEQILLGLTPGRIEKLHTLSQKLEVVDGQPLSTSFADKLNRLMAERKKS